MTLPDEPENYIHRIGRVGRADCMGLAISLVADNELYEKVWYHTCASRGKGCINRKLTSEGGCTIMYNEYSYFKAIEKRLNSEIPELTSNFELPLILADKQTKYGEESVNKVGIDNSIELRLSALSSTVQELAELEILAQNSFLYMYQ